MTRFGWDDLAELFLPGYPAGSWFAVDDSIPTPPIVGPRRKGHPHLLLDDLSFADSPVAKTYFRSASSGGIPHKAHARSCGERCIITKPGWVVTRLRSVAADHLKGNSSCREHDDKLLLAVEATRR